jgi:hypothetical protein
MGGGAWYGHIHKINLSETRNNTYFLIRLSSIWVPYYQTRIFLSSGTPQKGAVFEYFRKVFLTGAVCPLITLINTDYGARNLWVARAFGYARAAELAEYTRPRTALTSRTRI